MKKFFLLIVCILCCPGMADDTLAAEDDITINMMYTAQSGYRVRDMTMLQEVFHAISGIRVNIDYVPYEQQYEKIQELALTYDVLSLDQIWLADMVEQGILAPVDSYISRKMRDDLLPTILNAFRYQQQIWAVPFLLNYQLLFYNSAMLEKAGFTQPTTLEDMLDQMITLKEKGIVKYPWTDAWRQGENLLCEYVWLTGAFGGNLFDKDGKPIFDEGPGIKALEFMVTLIKEQLTHPNILTNDDIAAKNDFLSGEAAFTTNWAFLEGVLRFTQRTSTPTAVGAAPAATASTTVGTAPATATSTTVSATTGGAAGGIIPFRGAVGLIPVAKTITNKSASVSGFQGLAITAKSEYQEAAWKWIAFLTSPLVQRAFLSEIPIWTSVQTAEDTLLFDPLMPVKRTQLENVYHRPKLVNYTEISRILQQAIFTALQGQALPADALKAAKTDIETLMSTTSH
ncbi:extracellular solute-binding protein family 1 [Candidatus Vecturithrix granuli]|uniref:Extracellular solute-binding protein family 1 n=1 Tax=Vecturithrix granuli TaxID=1499967 RepID=A0A081BTW0_VECG1|nr:extracellular solute-binding protein family 1 [Candidatus Vecturithrix granuli]